MYFKWKKLCALSKKISLSAFSGCLQLMRLKKTCPFRITDIFLIYHFICYLISNEQYSEIMVRIIIQWAYTANLIKNNPIAV